MNIDKLGRQAIDIINSRYGLPKSGFIAGGSIGNLLWEIVSGNKAIINDIDVFLHEEIKNQKSENIFVYDKLDTKYYESYRQVSSCVYTTDSYSIIESINDGIFNYVKYESKNTSNKLIIESFDINCTRIGYSIDEDKLYWEKDFEEFLNTGKLKISNLNTPAHTAIRMVQKKNDLNAILDDFELSICQYAIVNFQQFFDIHKIRFKQRYADMYNKHESYLGRFFKLKNDEELQDTLSKNGIFDKIYYLFSDKVNIPIDKNDILVKTSSDFLFYMRHIYNNNELKVIWGKLYYLYFGIDYIDTDINIEEIDFLSEITKSHPKILENLKGLKLSQQINVVKNILEKISDYYDKETAIAVLENVNVSNISSIDNDDCLLLGLSVRKKINSMSFPIS